MSEVKGISTITNRAGTGAVDFSNGVNISGSDSGLSGFKHTEGATEPTSPSNGDTWWDTENEVYQIYVNDTWTTYIGASSSAVWYGDRGLHIGGLLNDNVTSLNVIQYFDITSTGNATDFGDLSAAEYTSDACSNGTYALNGGGYTTTLIDKIDYVTVATISNASDFGDLTQARSGISASSNGTYGLWKGGNVSSGETTIDYVTIETTGDATDFGDLTVGRFYGTSFANTTYALMAGGRISNTSNMQNTIDYVTVSTTGNATDFGDLGTVMEAAASASDSTYGVIGGGRDGVQPQDYQNIIQYVTIETPSNATDFGDLTVARAELGGCGNATRGVFSGGYGNTNGIFNTIDYVTIASTGNATDIGDLLQNIRLGCATSGAAS